MLRRVRGLEGLVVDGLRAGGGPTLRLKGGMDDSIKAARAARLQKMQEDANKGKKYGESACTLFLWDATFHVESQSKVLH